MAGIHAAAAAAAAASSSSAFLLPPRSSSHPLVRSSSTFALAFSHPLHSPFLAPSTSFLKLSRSTFCIPAPTPKSALAVVRAAFIFQWIGHFIRFITTAPMKLYAQKLEADLDKAAKMVKTGAYVVIEVAREADNIIEGVEKTIEQVEAFAEKVVKTTDDVEERVDDVLDVIEGEKKIVVTSYKLEDNTEVATQVVAKSSNASGNQTTQIVKDNKS